MWGIALTLLAALAVGFLAGGGPVLWLSLLVGLAVLGGDPGDPLTALVATAGAFAALSLLRVHVADRLRR
jgi:hypothetical protein